MKNPFITLTKTRGNMKIQININHIVSFEDQTYSDNKSLHCTYILLNNTAHASIHVKETFDQVASLIQQTIISNQ
jgi:hypothetical protein